MKTFALEDLPPPIVDALARYEVERSMREDGFLSPALELMVPAHVKEHQDWFTLATDVNRLSMAIFLDANGDAHPLDGKGIATRLLARSTDTFAAAVILAQRGLTVQSQSMSRTIFECAFWLGYIANKPKEAAEAFMADELFSRSQRGDLVAKHVEKEEADRIKKKAAADKAKSKEGIGAPQPKTVAERGGMEDAYIFYKALCGFAGHASLTSLDHYVDQTDKESFRLTIGPDIDGIPTTMLHAVMSQTFALRAFSFALERFDTDKESIEAIDDRLMTMMQGMGLSED